MLLFGGCNGSLGNKTNTVYCLDVNTFKWDTFNGSLTREIDGPKPECRYGHSQVTVLANLKDQFFIFKINENSNI